MRENEKESEKIAGIIIGESGVDEVSFIAKHAIEIGSYVVVESNNQQVLCMVKSISYENPFLNESIENFEAAKKIADFENEISIRGKLKVLGKTQSLEFSKIPIEPGSIVKKASDELLSEIFGKGEISIGNLLAHKNVEVKLDANVLLTRHLAILAITGAGKSNAVSVIVDGILKLNGMPVIFDMHSEYTDTEFIAKKVIEPKLNPLYLSLEEFRALVDIGKEAHIQERFLRKAWKAARESMKEKGDFITEILNNLEKISESADVKTQSEKNAIAAVINKVEDFNEKYSGIVYAYAADILSDLEPGKANVIDLGSVDEDYADVIVSHVMRKALYKRKKAELPPLFLILEEAHILAPAYRSTLSKYWAERIAREGRKFGVGLCLVSQRPKSLDSNSLSQANNAIIMKLIEPNDQRHVQQASERLSDDLLAHLPSLNTGEAIIIGSCIPVPAMVKIRLFRGKKTGSDISAIEEWKKFRENKERELREKSREAEELFSGMP